MQAHQIQRQETMMVLAKSPFEVFPISSTCLMQAFMAQFVYGKIGSSSRGTNGFDQYLWILASKGRHDPKFMGMLLFCFLIFRIVINITSLHQGGHNKLLD